MAYVNINGTICPEGEALLHYTNSSFRYGVGLFETMVVDSGHIRLAEYHWHRLLEGCALLNLPSSPVLTSAFMHQQVMATVQKNAMENSCRVRLQVSSAGGGIYGQRASEVSFFIECQPLKIISELPDGIITGVASGIVKSACSISHLKTTSSVVYAMAYQQALQRGWGDSLILNSAGNIVESSIANVFWIRNGRIFTPPISDGCISGVMRRCVINVANIEEQSLSLEQLVSADELFLTNSVKVMQSIKTVSGKTYLHKTTAELYHEVLDQLKHY